MEQMPEPKAKKMKKMVTMLGVLFVVIGILMHLSVLYLEFNDFGPLQEKYWSLDKATRDAALTGSDTSNMLVEIQKFPAKLMTLKLVGIGSLLTGIFISLMGIFGALTMMPKKLSAAIMKGKR